VSACIRLAIRDCQRAANDTEYQGEPEDNGNCQFFHVRLLREIVVFVFFAKRASRVSMGGGARKTGFNSEENLLVSPPL
jgi:hypothetical protein